MAIILQFPKLPTRVPVGDYFTVEESAATYVDVREQFANMIVDRNKRPKWMRFWGDHSEVEE